jgi:hypothetical protein
MSDESFAAPRQPRAPVRDATTLEGAQFGRYMIREKFTTFPFARGH